MTIRFYIDSETKLPHIYNHNIFEEEVEEVLVHPAEDRAGYDGARVALGRTSGGRFLKVVYLQEPGGVFVITAYELRGKPLQAFRRRMRKKHG